MDAPSSDTSAATDYLAETLTRSFSSSRLDHDSPFCSLRPSSSFTSSPSESCLHRSPSWNSSLNARAPEFKPRGTASPPSPMLSPSISSSSLASLSSSAGNLPALAQQSQQSDLAASIVIPRPPGPPALVHIMNSGGGAGNLCLKGIPALVGGHGGFLDQQPDLAVLANSDAADPSKFGISEETALKIINQVEFYFSDINLATTTFLFKIMIKDPEGFVPISVIASIKKIKTLTKSPSQLAAALRNSSKLVVSDDGKKVRRVHPLSELDMEEVQARIIIAENLPDDHCHQKLLKIFSAVGSLKAIRTCQPSSASTSKPSKTDGVNFSNISNKVHAFVEYDSVELAEKAVLELNEGNWRNGLKIRLLLKRSPKSAQARIRQVAQESENSFREEDGLGQEQIILQGKYLEDFIQQPGEPVVAEHANSKDDGLKKSRSRGEVREVSENRSWGKGRGKMSYSSNNRGNHMGVTQNVITNIEQTALAKQSAVPRMPDGTRGFSMGRGKPVSVRTA